MHKMNVLNLATTDDGGAGIAARNFNELLLKSGHHSVLVVKESKLKNENVIVIQKNPARHSPSFYIKKVKNRLTRLRNGIRYGALDPKYCFYNIDERISKLKANEILRETPFKPNVIILHWITNFINSKTIYKLQKRTNAKVLRVMMDNAPLTGGCHYPWDCIGFHSDCSNCPAILKSSKKIFAQRNLSLKKEYLPDNLELIACSESDYRRAQNASIYSKMKIHKLLLPIDEKKYTPGNKIVAKSFFGIKSNTKVIFYGSISLLDKRKGGQLFIEALKTLQNIVKENLQKPVDILILVAGNGDKDNFQNLDIPVLHIGYLNEEKLIKAFQAADVFVSTSVEDSGPLMINQSILSGTPVIAFEMGIALDLVITGQTGYRSKLKDSADLANGIKYILDLNEQKYKKMCENCCELGLELCHPQKQAEKLKEICNNNIG